MEWTTTGLEQKCLGCIAAAAAADVDGMRTVVNYVAMGVLHNHSYVHETMKTGV
jgi:hypothetical protein